MDLDLLRGVAAKRSRPFASYCSCNMTDHYVGIGSMYIVTMIFIVQAISKLLSEKNSKSQLKCTSRSTLRPVKNYKFCMSKFLWSSVVKNQYKIHDLFTQG